MNWTKIAFLSTTALAFSGGIALARVGVTSATSGDPLAKPPTEAERVLRIGIDIQANELITTTANDRAHLLFIDGTSLTVGPNAHLTIDKFVFHPDTKTGELSVSATKGLLRVVGGKISKKSEITITTPSSTVGIRGGITILNVEPTRTTSTFIFGKSMSVSSLGQTTMVTRQGSQVMTNVGAPPGLPMTVPAGGLTGDLRQLEGTASSGSGSASSTSGGGPAATSGSGNNTNRLGAGTSSGTAGSSGSSLGANSGTAGATGSETRSTPDQIAKASGFSNGNSGQAPAAVPTPQIVIVSTGSPAQAVMNANIVSNALSNTTPAAVPTPNAVSASISGPVPNAGPPVPPGTTPNGGVGGNTGPVVGGPTTLPGNTPNTGGGGNTGPVVGGPTTLPSTLPNTAVGGNTGPVVGGPTTLPSNTPNAGSASVPAPKALSVAPSTTSAFSVGRR